MNWTFLVAALCAAATLAGCQSTPTTPEDYMERCTKRVQNWDYGIKSEAAIYTGTTIERMPEVTCRRVLKAIQQGRLKQEDFRGLERRGSPFWKVIKGQ